MNVENKIIARIEFISGIILATFGAALFFNQRVDKVFLSVISFILHRSPNLQWPDKLHLVAQGMLVTAAILIGLFILPYWDGLNFKQNKLVIKLAMKWERYKQNKFVRIMGHAGATIIIWIMIIVKEFSFSFIGNETDYLPSIKQAVDRAWLPNDWYLNLNISYRQGFDFIFGELVSKFGFVNGAYLGRLLAYLLVAIAIYIFFRTIHLRPLFGILVLLFFLNHQSLAAGEWIVGGLETKTIAYAMVILSFSFFLRKRYFIGFALAGAAISFHVLVGGYALICILVASLLNKSWRTEWRLYLKNFWPFLITGSLGIWAVVEELIPQRGIDVIKAWNIYVYYRVPDHVMPFTWTNLHWKPELALATGLFIIIYFMRTSKSASFVAAFALGSVSMFLIGLGIYTIRDTTLLRFYWFRFPDVMLPFLSAALIALFLNDFADRHIIKKSLFQEFQLGLQTLLRLLPPTIIILLVVMMIQQTNRLQISYKDSLYNDPGTILPAFEWISKNTPKQALFLVDPTELEFYIDAQRAMLVSWKHSPQSAGPILEWYKRIELCNGNASLVKGDSAASVKQLHTNFYKLDQTQIQQIANLYGTNYYVGLADQQLTFERVYSDSMYAIFKIK